MPATAAILDIEGGRAPGIWLRNRISQRALPEHREPQPAFVQMQLVVIKKMTGVYMIADVRIWAFS